MEIADNKYNGRERNYLKGVGTNKNHKSVNRSRNGSYRTGINSMGGSLGSISPVNQDTGNEVAYTGNQNAGLQNIGGALGTLSPVNPNTPTLGYLGQQPDYSDQGGALGTLSPVNPQTSSPGNYHPHHQQTNYYNQGGALGTISPVGPNSGNTGVYQAPGMGPYHGSWVRPGGAPVVSPAAKPQQQYTTGLYTGPVDADGKPVSLAEKLKLALLSRFQRT